MAGDKPTDGVDKSTPATAHDALAQQAFKAPEKAPDKAPEADNSTLTRIHDFAHSVATTTENAADTVGRFATVTYKTATNGDMAKGVWHAAQYDVKHWDETAKMLIDSAALGASLKVVMSSKGPLGAVGGLLIGGYMLAESAAPIKHAYGEAMDAKTDKEFEAASAKLGDAYGAFGVNTAIGMAGYKVGAGATGRVLEGEAFDDFAVKKERAWDWANKGAISLAKTVVGKGAEAPEVLGVDTEGAAMATRARLLNSAKSAPKGDVVGEVDPDAKVSITLMAKTKGDPVLMDRTINRIARRGQAPLTDQQIIERFGTDETSKAAVEKFIADHGLTVTDTNHASGRYFVEGNAASMKKAFGVNWQQYENDGIQFRGRSGTLSVNHEVAPHIKAVLGLDNRPQYHPNYVKLADFAAKTSGNAEATDGTATTAPSAISAIEKIGNQRPVTAVGHTDAPAGPAPAAGDGAAVQTKASGARALDVNENFKAYNEPMANGKPKHTGKGMVTGFLSLGGTMPEPWLDYMKSKGLDPNTFSERNTSNIEPKPDPRGANGENGLDGVIHKEALPDAETVMVKAPNNDSGMPDGIDRITFPKKGESQITHASVSWGQFEDGWTAQARAAMEDAGKRAALKGITITVAAGDNGAGDGSPSKKQQVDIPAGLEHYTAVGGTLLTLKPDGTYGSEKSWSGMGATGGGRSMFTLRPIWQKFLSLPKNLNGSSFDGRGVPDIAANGDPRSGWNTPTDDGVTPIGGTSASAPAEAVALAKVAQATGKTTGFVNPQLYDFGKNQPQVFNDVTVGNNTDAGIKGYPANSGYDLNTGWGSINIGNMIDAYSKLGTQGKFATARTEVGQYLRYDQGTRTPGWLLPVGSQNNDTEKEQQIVKEAVGAR